MENVNLDLAISLESLPYYMIVNALEETEEYSNSHPPIIPINLDRAYENMLHQNQNQPHFQQQGFPINYDQLRVSKNKRHCLFDFLEWLGIDVGRGATDQNVNMVFHIELMNEIKKQQLKTEFERMEKDPNFSLEKQRE